MALFPSEMMSNSGGALSIEGVAAKLSFFYEQVHLFHWQTKSYAEHEALGGFYSKLVDFKDEIVEKLMGYNNGQRVKSFKISPISDYSSGLSSKIVQQVADFAKELEDWAEEKEYCDIENIAQSLGGEASKVLYLLTLT